MDTRKEDHLEFEPQSQLQRNSISDSNHSFQQSQEEGKMDIKLVYEMFKDLKSEMASNKIVEGVSRISALEKRQDDMMDIIFDMKEELVEYKTKTILLNGVVSHLSQVVQDLGSKMEKMELSNMKKSVVLYGLLTTRKKLACIQELYSFFEYEMDIKPAIEDVFFLNLETTSPLVVVFKDVKSKMITLNNVSKLKGLVNDEGKAFSSANTFLLH